MKFYDGVIFIGSSKALIQGGDPLGTGTGGSSERIKGEFSANGVNNTLKHTRGVISMARQSQPMDSASSQFLSCMRMPRIWMACMRHLARLSPVWRRWIGLPI